MCVFSLEGSRQIEAALRLRRRAGARDRGRWMLEIERGPGLRERAVAGHRLHGGVARAHKAALTAQHVHVDDRASIAGELDLDLVAAEDAEHGVG